MPERSADLERLAERFAHPAVRVLVRELTQLARDLERGAQCWPPPAGPDAALPGLEAMQAALGQRHWYRRLAADQQDWQHFAQVICGTLDLSSAATQHPAPNAPHPAAVVALRLVWGAERFAELPTVVLKPPPAEFLAKLAQLPAPARRSPPAELDRALAAWLAQLWLERQPNSRAFVSAGAGRLRGAANRREFIRQPPEAVRGFARVAAACRAIGQLRTQVELEDRAAGYLAWARLLRADLRRLTDASSGWWSPSDRQLGRKPQR